MLLASPLGFPQRENPRSGKIFALPFVNSGATMPAQIFYVLLEARLVTRKMKVNCVSRMANHKQNVVFDIYERFI